MQTTWFSLRWNENYLILNWINSGEISHCITAKATKHLIPPFNQQNKPSDYEQNHH